MFLLRNRKKIENDSDIELILSKPVLLISRKDYRIELYKF